MSEIVYQDRYLRMDVLSRKVHVNGSLVILTPTEWRVLAKLIWYSGRPIYPRDFDWMRATLRNYIKALRRKLGFSLDGPIVSTHGVGYRYNA